MQFCLFFIRDSLRLDLGHDVAKQVFISFSFCFNILRFSLQFCFFLIRNGLRLDLGHDIAKQVFISFSFCFNILRFSLQFCFFLIRKRICAWIWAMTSPSRSSSASVSVFQHLEVQPAVLPFPSSETVCAWIWAMTSPSRSSSASALASMDSTGISSSLSGGWDSSSGIA